MAAGRRGIGFKLTFAVVALIVAALASSTGLANYIISLTMEKNLRERMEDATKALKAAFDLKVAEVEIFTDAFSSDPEYQRKTSFNADDEIKVQGQSFAERAKFDVVIAQGVYSEGTDADKTAMRTLAALAPKGMNPEHFISAVQELKAKNTLISQPVVVDGRLFFLAVAPVRFFGRVIGFLVCGREFTTATAMDLRTRLGAEVVLIVGKGLVAKTLAIDAGTVARLSAAFAVGTKHVGVESFSIGEESYFAKNIPILNGATQIAILVAAQSQKAIVEARRETLKNFLRISVVLFAIGTAMGLILARRISRPIVAIEKKFRQILDSGDLALRVPETFKDEIGLMAKTFNVMQQRVQELHVKLVESERRMRQELEMAAVVQEMLFPALPPESPAIELANFVSTSSETGGDWYGFMVNPQAGTTTVIVADVTGHGVPAALVTAIIHGFFRAVDSNSLGAHLDWVGDALNLSAPQRGELAKRLANQGLSLTSILQMLNRVLIDSTKGSLFVTLFLSTLHHETRILEYVNAAHNLPLVLRTGGGRPEVGVLPSAPSNRLGDSADLRLVPRRVQLSKGDTVIWYTDGLIECENEAGDEYGQKRLTRLIAHCVGMDAPAMKDKIVEESYKFYGNCPRKDDITLVVGRVK